MKIIKENKEVLPIDFVTQQISKGWDEVGLLNASIDAIKRSFKGTAKVEEILQDLADAYLISISRLQAFLSDKDYVEIPEESVQESLTEELPDKKIFDKKEEVQEEPIDDLADAAEAIDDAPEVDKENFEFTCDFDELPEAEATSDRQAWLAQHGN